MYSKPNFCCRALMALQIRKIAIIDCLNEMCLEIEDMVHVSLLCSVTQDVIPSICWLSDRLLQTGLSRLWFFCISTALFFTPGHYYVTNASGELTMGQIGYNNVNKTRVGRQISDQQIY